MFIVKFCAKNYGYKDDYNTIPVLNCSPKVPLSFLCTWKAKFPTVNRQLVMADEM